MVGFFKIYISTSIHQMLLFCFQTPSCFDLVPGAPLTYFNDGEVRQRFIFYTQKNPNFRICLPKKKTPLFFSIPQKIPQCFCISKFWSKTKLYIKNTKSSHDCYSVSSSYLLRQLYRKIFIMTSTACLVLSTFFACCCTGTSLRNRPRGIRLFAIFLCN